MSGSNRQVKSQLWIAGAYGLLIVIMLIFLIVLGVLTDKSTYQIDWAPDAARTILDVVKVLVGAVIGALTPVAVHIAKASTDPAEANNVVDAPPQDDLPKR